MDNYTEESSMLYIVLTSTGDVYTTLRAPTRSDVSFQKVKATPANIRALRGAATLLEQPQMNPQEQATRDLERIARKASGFKGARA